MPRIAIDYTPAYEQSAGIGRLVRELIHALAVEDTHTEYRLFVSGARAHNLANAPGDNFYWRSVPISPQWMARIWHRLRIPLPVQAFMGNVDLYHATDFVLPPVLPGTKTIVTVHDLTFVRVPDAASPRLKAYLDAVVPRSVQRAWHIIADSQATKDDLIEVYGVAPEKITVVLSGVDKRFERVSVDQPALRTKYNIPERPYLFTVGTVQPRKNYGRLVEALAILRRQGYDIYLVIAGGRGWLDSPLYATINDLNMQDYVHLIGFADDEDLPALYSAAACMTFPSLYEGFGLPILEAMGCGTPVVTSNVSSLPEVAGDAALMVDPYDPEAIAEAIQRILDDSRLREQLIERGHAQAKRFTWSRAAQQLIQVYTKVLAV